MFPFHLVPPFPLRAPISCVRFLQGLPPPTPLVAEKIHQYRIRVDLESLMACRIREGECVTKEGKYVVCIGVLYYLSQVCVV
jgi:hypothetical protein